jgi:uncharacterized SAM-binding protein YcdF (DUF218 family)
MFFIFSKTLNFITNPLVIICLFLIISLIVKRAKLKKILFWTSFALLLFFSNDFVANEVMRAWEISPSTYASLNTEYSLGIVLTGVTSTDRMPDDRVYFNHGADRVVHAVQLYKLGIIRKILITGGSGRLVTEGRREADDVFKAMVLMGVPSTDLIVENQSRNTYESAVNVKRLLQDSASTKSLLITSAFHMRRSNACFKKAALPVDLFSTDFYTHPRYFTPDSLMIPQVDALTIWQKLFKEWAGLFAYKLAGYI